MLNDSRYELSDTVNHQDRTDTSTNLAYVRGCVIMTDVGAFARLR